MTINSNLVLLSVEAVSYSNSNNSVIVLPDKTEIEVYHHSNNTVLDK